MGKKKSPHTYNMLPFYSYEENVWGDEDPPPLRKEGLFSSMISDLESNENICWNAS